MIILDHILTEPFILKISCQKVLRLETVIEICLRYTIDPALDITLKIVMDPVSTKMLTKEYNESVNTIKEVLRRNIKTLIADFSKKNARLFRQNGI